MNYYFIQAFLGRFWLTGWVWSSRLPETGKILVDMPVTSAFRSWGQEARKLVF